MTIITNSNDNAIHNTQGKKNLIRLYGPFHSTQHPQETSTYTDTKKDQQNYQHAHKVFHNHIAA